MNSVHYKLPPSFDVMPRWREWFIRLFGVAMGGGSDTKTGERWDYVYFRGQYYTFRRRA